MRRICSRVSRGRRGPFLLFALSVTAPAGARPGSSAPVPQTAPGRQAPAGAVVAVTWPDLVRRAERHPRLCASRLEIEAARGGVTAAGAVPNPSLEAHAGPGFTRAGGTSRLEWGLAVSVPLGWLAQRGAEIARARAEVETALATTEVLRREVLLELWAAFAGLAQAQEQVAVLAAYEAETETLVEAVGERVARGEARPVEATRVEIELEQVRSELQAAQIVLAARGDALALRMGAPVTNTLVAVTAVDLAAPAMPREAALNRARVNDPALPQAQARARLLDAEVATSRRGRAPNFALTGFTAQELDRRAYGLGVAVDIPVWSFNAGPVARAEARRAAGEKLAEAAALERDTAVVEAQAACEAASAAAARLRDEVMPRAETAAAMLERSYRLGEASLLEVIDARRTLLRTRRLTLDALAQARSDCGRLDVLVGEEPR